MNLIGSILRKIRLVTFNVLGKINPKIVARIMYFEAHRKLMNLKNPTNLDEKINWMKFNTNTSKWSILADKYEVRNYISDLDLDYILNTVYEVVDSPDDIDLSKLPKSFVIKTTNGSGGSQVLLVKDKTKINWPEIQQQLNRWLNYNASYLIAEPHYSKIKSRLLIEKLLENQGHESLIDYKFHCFNGKVASCLVCSERINGHALKSIYDLDWHQHPEYVLPKYRRSPYIPRPQSLDKMIDICKKLSAGFPYVRVDLYEIDGNPIFSELTFTPAGGYNKTMTFEYLQFLGEHLQLPA